jgi:hypothetical protein
MPRSRGTEGPNNETQGADVKALPKSQIDQARAGQMRAAANTHRALKQDEVKEKLQVNSELDEWIRRRMRMCYWKQWRWPRTKIKNLLALGVSLKSAIQHGCSSNSYWQMSRTPVINQAFPTRGYRSKVCSA